MKLLAFALAAFAALYGVVDWRRGIYAVIAIGFLQDPLRKLVPGSTVVLTVLVVGAFVGVVLGALRRGELARLGEPFRWFPELRAPAVLFATIVLVQSAATYVRTRSPMLAGLGLLSYLSPLVAIAIGQRLFLDPERALRLLRFYCAAGVLLALTVVAQFAGFRHPIFRSIGGDTVYGIGGRVEMMCGFMRSSEIAAWHLGIAASVAFALSLAARRLWIQLASLALTLVALTAVTLTGRRKMIVEFVLFLLCYGLVLFRRRGGAPRLVAYLTAAGMGLFLAGSVLLLTGRLERLIPYLDRSFSVVGESTTRLSGMTIGSFDSVFGQSGFFGRGAGTGSQGSQYFGGGVEIVGGAAEGGALKILAELGVPGAVAALWLAVVLGRALLRCVRAASSTSLPSIQLLVGVGALFPANAAVFVTAHQVFGDPFVVILLGLFLGMTLALPRHLHLQRALAQQLAPSGAPPAARTAVGASDPRRSASARFRPA